jgi:hypothetical protein
MDIDQLLRESGARWRQAQPPSSGYDVEALVSAGRASGGRRWQLTVTAAVAAAAAAVAAVIVASHMIAVPAVPRPASSPVPSLSAVSQDQVVGTWHSTVSPTIARARHRNLVGDWILSLDRDGTARLRHVNTTVDLRGQWRLSGTKLTLSVRLAGCPVGEATYQPERSTLHPGMLSLFPVDGAESCTARALVLTGEWQRGSGAG